MTPEQMQQEITTIKNMIDKTRRETAESGRLFIFLGIGAVLFVLIISLLEIYQLFNWVLPTMIGLTILNGFIGYLVVGREVKREKVTAYPKTIVLSMMMICGFTVLLLTFLFPFLKVYSWHALPILVCLIFGIAVFMTGMIYELRFIQWFSLSWWAGAILMALYDGEFRFLIMIGTIIFGWIVPGLILNQKYKNRSK
ncbi:hypothetical protein L0128_06125 [candidate division KSB1 bacterium]|nr:hypothetical protein [candidate division KSB1 bacterium]